LPDTPVLAYIPLLVAPQVVTMVVLIAGVIIGAVGIALTVAVAISLFRAHKRD
jgi:hypothetical protein